MPKRPEKGEAMTDASESIDLDELRRLAEAATPGPWVADPPSAYDSDDCGGYQMQSCVRKFDSGSITWDDQSGEVFTPADAEFIAATDPDTVLVLTARLCDAERRIEKVVRLRDRMERQRDDIDESVRLSMILVDLNAALTEGDEQ